MKYLYLAVFFIFTSIHLYASWRKDRHLRNFSKGFILFPLLGFYASSVDEINWVIVAAIVTSWIGDLFLILRGIKWFAIGGASFMISHCLFITAYCYDFSFSNIPIWVIILLGLLFAGAVTFIFTRLKKYLKIYLFIPMFIYLLINGTMNCFAIFRLIGNFCLPTIITAIGAILFFASDTSLFFVRFNQECRLKSHFFVMLTYSIGEFLIILGLVLL